MAMTTGSKGLKAEMNVTPMIDVLLVLLVIFMIVTPLKPNGLQVQVPQGQRPDDVRGDPGPSTDLVLSVRADGKLDLNSEPVELANLQARLAEIFKFRGSGVLFVRGEDTLKYEEVARVIDLAKGAGMTRVALMTTPAT